jgi:hypothetical protein
MEELFERKFQEEDSEFLDFLNRYAGGKTEAGVKAMIDKAYTAVMSIPDPFAWLDSGIEKLKIEPVEFQSSLLAEEIRGSMDQSMDLAVRSFSRVCDLLEETGIPELHQKAEEDRRMIWELKNRMKEVDLQEALALTEEVSYQRFVVKKKIKKSTRK